MEFIDLKKQHKILEKDIASAIKNVLNHGRYIKGPEVKLLEEELSDYTGAENCILVANGTDALEIALKAINISPNDEVLVPPLSFVATCNAIRWSYPNFL